MFMMDMHMNHTDCSMDQVSPYHKHVKICTDLQLAYILDDAYGILLWLSVLSSGQFIQLANPWT
jgi:hypothetical protein